MKKLEICCGSVTDVQIVSQFKVDSIELNHALELGGMTPSLATLKQSKALTDIPLFCMVRPVPGGFIYTDNEVNTMRQEAIDLLEAGADGIVFGFLTQHLEIDLKLTTEFINIAHSYHKQAIFHRAIDLTPNLVESYKLLIDLGIDRVLTSGGQPKAIDAIETLKSMVAINPEKILVGSGINPDNITEFGFVDYVHASCKDFVDRINGNGLVSFDVGETDKIGQTSAECIKKLLKKLY